MARRGLMEGYRQNERLFSRLEEEQRDRYPPSYPYKGGLTLPLNASRIFRKPLVRKDDVGVTVVYGIYMFRGSNDTEVFCSELESAIPHPGALQRLLGITYEKNVMSAIRKFERKAEKWRRIWEETEKSARNAYLRLAAYHEIPEDLSAMTFESEEASYGLHAPTEAMRITGRQITESVPGHCGPPEYVLKALRMDDEIQEMHNLSSSAEASGEEQCKKSAPHVNVPAEQQLKLFSRILEG